MKHALRPVKYTLEYSVMQSDWNSFYGDLVLDSVSMASPHKLVRSICITLYVGTPVVI